MGGYKKHKPIVYLIEWPDGVLKVGYTANERWRKHVINGGRVVSLFQCETSTQAFALETVGYDFLRGRCNSAFTDKKSAEVHLGTGGGGWAECFSGTETDADALLNHMLEHYPEHQAKHYLWEA